MPSVTPSASVTDTRRVCDLSPAELFEAAMTRCDPLGWAAGKWDLALGFEDAHLLRAKVPVLVSEGRVTWATVGRAQLHRLGVSVESEAA